MNERIDVFALPVHALADKFPMLGEDGLLELANDISENGLRDPLVVQEIGGILTLVDDRGAVG